MFPDKNSSRNSDDRANPRPSTIICSFGNHSDLLHVKQITNSAWEGQRLNSEEPHSNARYYSSRIPDYGIIYVSSKIDE